MNKIEAIIRPYKLEEVRDALQAAGVQGLTVEEVKGFGHLARTGDLEPNDDASFTPLLKIEIVIEDDDTEKIVQVILETAATGRNGDGKIFVTPVHDAIAIRTGAHGSKVL